MSCPGQQDHEIIKFEIIRDGSVCLQRERIAIKTFEIIRDHF